MQIFNYNNYEVMSRNVAKQMFTLVSHKKDACICLATGHSPKLAYAYFVDMVNVAKIDMSQITFVKLDEWYQVAMEESFTCESFIKEHVLNKLHQPIKQYISFDSNTKDANDSITSVETQLAKIEIDMMILGLGMNGHLGLNEPNEYLQYHSHYTLLDEKTKTHDMVKEVSMSGGISLGLKAIFESKEVVMIVCGTHKEEAYEMFMSKKITTQNPASLLWLHSNCNVFIDEESFS